MPKVYVVVQDCLAYWATEKEREEGWDAQLGDLDKDVAFQDVYSSDKSAQQKCDELNLERKKSGAENNEWDFYVIARDVQD